MALLWSFISFAIIGLVLIVIKKLIDEYTRYNGKTNIPKIPGGWPIIGDLLWFLGVKDTKDLFKIINNLFSKYGGKAISLYIGPRLVILLQDAQLIEKVLTSTKFNTKDPTMYRNVKKLGDGVLSRSGKAWSDLRKPLDKLLNSKKMDTYFDLLVQKANKLCMGLDEDCDKGTFDITHRILYYMLDISLEVHFGVEGTYMTHDPLNVASSMELLLSTIALRTARIEYQLDSLFNLSELGKQSAASTKNITPLFNKIFESRFKEYAETNTNPDDPNFTHKYYSDILIQVLNRERQSEETRRFSAFDLLAASFDTSTHSLCASLLYIAMHPHVQEKLYQEQLNIMKDSLLPPTLEDISQMNYLQMVFNETLRHVSVPAIMRLCGSDTVIDGYTFPEGASVYIGFHYAMKNPEYWERPSEFYPEHFLPEIAANRPKGAFLPFSSGPRSCPGKQFGLVSVYLVMSTILRRYLFSTHLKFNELTYKHAVMVECEGGYNVALTRRPLPTL